MVRNRLDIFELTPARFLVQNEIDPAKTIRLAELNVQKQQKIEYLRQLIVAKAYVDQLERSQALPSNQIASLRQTIQKAESSRQSQTELEKLKRLRHVFVHRRNKLFVGFDFYA